MPKSLKAWADRAVEMFASRIAGGVFLLCAVAFGAHAALFPMRLPPLEPLGLRELGLVMPFQGLVEEETLAAAKEEAARAAESAQPYVGAFLEEQRAALEANIQAKAWINLLGAFAGAALLVGSMALRIAREPRIRTV